LSNTGQGLTEGSLSIYFAFTGEHQIGPVQTFRQTYSLDNNVNAWF